MKWVHDSILMIPYNYILTIILNRGQCIGQNMVQRPYSAILNLSEKPVGTLRINQNLRTI